VAILVATAVLSYTDRQVLSLLVDPVRAELQITDTQISLLLGTAFAVVYGIAGVPLGYLADRTSRRNLILAGVLVWSLGTLACGLSRSFGQLFVARVVVGLGEAVLSPAAISLISDYFPPARRGLAVGAFLSGIAMGVGVSILIGGGVLHLVQQGAFAATALRSLPAWRLVLVLIGAPGLLWALAILVIREPRRQPGDASGSPGANAATGAGRPGGIPAAVVRAAPIYLIVAMASLVDNAVGAWGPTLLIREFGHDAAHIGVQLGLYITAGFGGGVLLGGWLADRAGAAGGWSRKLLVCLLSGALILPVAAGINAGSYAVVLTAIPLYFAFSGVVTACGFSAILDVVPNSSRGLAMAISFFLNVAIGAGAGPTAVAVAQERLFGTQAGLGPAIASVVACGYLVAIAAVLAAQRTARPG
jgi:MFS family permease